MAAGGIGRESSILQFNRRSLGKTLRGGFVLSHYQNLADFEHEWRELETHASLTPFQSFDWLNCWLNTVGSAKNSSPLLIVISNERGAPVLVAPLSIERKGPFKALTWLGSEINDYNAPVLGPDDADYDRITEQFSELWVDVLDHLASLENCKFDFVNFSKMPALVGTRKNPFTMLDNTLNASRAHMTALPRSWDEMYARRSSSTRSRDRSKLRRLGEFGEVKYFEPQTTKERLEVTNRLLQLKSVQLAEMGARNRFDAVNYRQFIQFASGIENIIHVSALKIGENIVAANLGLMLNKCYYHFLMAYDQGEVSKFGPGAAHLRELLQFAIRSGAETFDFTIGNESYKKDWCDTEMPLYDYRASQSARGRIAVLGAQNFYRLKGWVKNNRQAWLMYLKFRSILGGLSGRKVSSTEN